MTEFSSVYSSSRFSTRIEIGTWVNLSVMSRLKSVFWLWSCVSWIHCGLLRKTRAFATLVTFSSTFHAKETNLRAVSCFQTSARSNTSRFHDNQQYWVTNHARERRVRCRLIKLRRRSVLNCKFHSKRLNRLFSTSRKFVTSPWINKRPSVSSPLRPSVRT